MYILGHRRYTSTIAGVKWRLVPLAGCPANVYPFKWMHDALSNLDVPAMIRVQQLVWKQGPSHALQKILCHKCLGTLQEGHPMERLH